MGSSIGWILIQTDSDNFVSKKIITDIFSPYNLEESEINLRQLKNERFSPKEPKHIQIFKSKKFIGISNIPLAESFFNTQNNSIAYSYYKYFDKPKLIFIILENDSPEDFGYCIIENGKIKRFYLSQGGDYKILEFGNRNEFESDWFNAIKESKWEEEADMGTLTNMRTKEKIQIYSLSRKLLEEAVDNFTGRTTSNFDELVTERTYFRILEKAEFKIQKNVNAIQNNKIKITILISTSIILYYIIKMHLLKPLF